MGVGKIQNGVSFWWDALLQGVIFSPDSMNP
jgi:hypothetical protein